MLQNDAVIHCIKSLLEVVHTSIPPVCAVMYPQYVYTNTWLYAKKATAIIVTSRATSARSELLSLLELPGLSQLMNNPWSRTSWKDRLLKTNALLNYHSNCGHLPIFQWSFEAELVNRTIYFKRVKYFQVNGYEGTLVT